MTDATRTAPPRRLLAVLLLGQAMASMDTSIAAVAAPAIRADLAGPPAVQQLVLAGYTLAFAVLVVTGARLGARHGYGRVFLLGLAGFTAASLLCGLAPAPAALVAARITQGATGAVMVPQVLSLIQAHFAGPARVRALARYSMVLALGVAAGQIAGGLLVTLDLGGLSWRTAFLVNVPVGVVLLLLGWRVLGALPPARAERRPLDRVGMLLLSAAMLAVVLPMVLGTELGWTPVMRGLAVAVGVAGLAICYRYEARLGRRGGDPLLDVRVLRYPGVLAGLVACYGVMGCYAAFLFTLTLRLQDGLGFSALAAGLAFVPYASGFALCGLAVPRLPERLRDALPVAGPVVLAVAAVGLVVVARQGWPWVTGSLLLFAAGAGHAAAFSPLVARISAALPAAAAAAYSALVSTGTLLAGVLGVAGVGGLYLVVAGTRGTGDAFALAVLAVVAVLLLGATAAVRAVRAARAAAVPAGPAAADPAPAASR